MLLLSSPSSDGEGLCESLVEFAGEHTSDVARARCCCFVALDVEDIVGRVENGPVRSLLAILGSPADAPGALDRRPFRTEAESLAIEARVKTARAEETQNLWRYGI